MKIALIGPGTMLLTLQNGAGHARVREHLRKAPDGYTSIYADLKNGRKTEADFICGAVARAAHDQGFRVPVQETILRLVHAMEER